MGNEIIVKNIINKAETQALEIDSLEGRAPGEILEDLACFLLGNKDMFLHYEYSYYKESDGD